MEQLRPSEPVQQPVNTNNGSNVTMQAQETVQAQAPVTKTVDMNNIAPETTKFTVDLFQGESDASFLKNKTADAMPDADHSQTKYINPGATQNTNLPGIPQNPTTIHKSKDDLRGGVKAALMVVDYVISLIAMKIAGDTRQSAYTADTQQKKLLEDVLVEYLYGKQANMPVWLTLTFAVAGSYGLILVDAGQKRYKIIQRERDQEANGSTANQNNTQQQTYTQAPVKQYVNSDAAQRSQQTQRVPVSDQDMKRYQEIKPPVTPPQTPYVMEQSFNVGKDGTAVPTGDVKYSHWNPDPSITAKTLDELTRYVSNGIFPRFRLNKQGKQLVVKYSENGTPLIPGNPQKIRRR